MQDIKFLYGRPTPTVLLIYQVSFSDQVGWILKFTAPLITYKMTISGVPNIDRAQILHGKMYEWNLSVIL